MWFVPSVLSMNVESLAQTVPCNCSSYCNKFLCSVTAAAATTPS
jgi:hypothetical protein